MKTEIKYVDGVNYDIAKLDTLAEYGPIDVFMERYDKKELNVQDKYGFSLLHNAISGKQWDIAEFLINEGYRCKYGR